MKCVAFAPVTSFLCMTLVVSVVFGLLAFQVGGERTFESPAALPLLLVTIWSPTLCAVVVSAAEGELKPLIASATRPGSPWSWLIALVPLVVALGLAAHSGVSRSLSPKTWLLLICMNLFMGPLGEELGWRGFLLPRLVDRHGALLAAIEVGVVWAVWHLPLWALPSPQREIPFLVFLFTVVSFSVVMTAAHQLGRGALLPCIVFHLLANVGVGWLELSKTMSARSSYECALPVYGAAAIVAGIWLHFARGDLP